MTALSTLPSHLDRILLMIGSPGRYHFLVAFLVCCMQFPVSFHDHLLKFYTATPKHRCRAKSNLTLGDYDLRPIVIINGRSQYSACELYKDPLDHSKGTKPCTDGSEFLLNYGDWSVVTEWELVCENEYLRILLPYITAAIGMIGAMASGLLSDKYGRKYVLLISLLVHTSLGLFLHFLPLYGIFVTLFSIQGFLISAIQCSSYLLLIENLPTQWQWRAAFSITVFQCCGQLLLAILAWLIRNWRYIQLAISAPGVVVIGYFWLLPRSLAWLVVENKYHSAQLQLEKFSKDPSKAMSPNLKMQLLKSCRVTLSTPGSFAARHSFETIVCSARLRKLAFVQYYLWFVVSLVSKISVEDIPAIKDNAYSRLFVKGVIGLSFAIFIFLGSTKIGLKLTQASSLTICGVCCMFAAVVDHQVIQMRFRFVAEKGLHHFAPVLALLGQSIANGSFLTLWMHAVKTFPSGVRGLGLGSCMFWGKLAYLFIPDIDSLGSSSRFTVLAIAGALTFIGGLLSNWLLPDCTERPLATIAEEVEVNRIKTINDSDLDFRDTSITSGFSDDISPDYVASSSSTTSSSSNTCERTSKNILKRLTSLLREKKHKILGHSASEVIPQLNYAKETYPISIVMENDLFEPVTGFVFKWDQGEPTIKLTDFEKEMAVYWKPNSDSIETNINDKHLNSLNILYNIQTNAGEIHDTSL